MNIGQTLTILNLSTQKYWLGQERLLKSVGQYNFLAWSHEHTIGAPLHTENMYAFKPHAFKFAYDLGYRKLLWLDASMLAIKDIKPIFDIIAQDGYFFQDSGWMNERWCPDHVKEHFGTNEGHMLSSGVLGLDLDSDVGTEFLARWRNAADLGLFNGSHAVTRHDQLCASLIAFKMGLKLQTANTFFVYGKPGNKYVLTETVLLADGIC